MKRLKSMEKYLNSYMVKWLEIQIESVKQADTKELENIIKKLFMRIDNIQDSCIWKPAYLSVFFLYSSLVTKTCEYQICLSNNEMYFDKQMLNEYWRPPYIDVPEVELLRTILKKKFVRIQDYELIYLQRMFAEQYKKILEVYMSKVFRDVAQTLWFQAVHKEKMFVFVYGEYMGEIKPVLILE